ncbi:hypothetical protein [Vreelandella aquamarina]|uniref:hypothetical protein n=1 Tax=Vreelandella aquamarina TaxID=77097 RepID=UPI00384BF471
MALQELKIGRAIHGGSFSTTRSMFSLALAITLGVANENTNENFISLAMNYFYNKIMKL